MKFKIEECSNLKKWLKGDGKFEVSWNGYEKTINIRDFRACRKENKLEYPNDPDVNVKRRWGIHSNGAQKGNPKDSCLDWSLELGHIEINYTNWVFNKKYRK